MRLTATTPAPGTDPETILRSRLRAACEGFEAIFMRELLADARGASLGEGLLDGDRAAEITATMHDDALADAIARGGGMGIADLLQGQLWPSVRARAIASHEITDTASSGVPHAH